MKHFYVYILKCNDGSFYTGHTDDMEKRLAEHSAKEIPSYTSDKLPVDLVYMQEFMNRSEAIDAEHQIKRWSRKKKEALINQSWDELKKNSRKIFTKKSTYFDFIE